MHIPGFAHVFNPAVLTGAPCSVSSPQCYKNTTRPDDDFLCEWQDRDRSSEAIYTIFMQYVIPFYNVLCCYFHFHFLWLSHSSTHKHPHFPPFV